MSFLSFVLDLFFPPKCVFCARVLNKSDKGICERCMESLPFTENHGHQDGEIFDFCVSPLYYTDVVRRSILRYKFRGASYYAPVYASLLAQCIRECKELSYDIISWVPLSEKRESSRGYDQAKLLAVAAAHKLNKNATSTLIKVRDVKAQSELGDKEERSRNISGAYEASDPQIVAGKRVLLVDDIITTSSTLDECADVLLKAGAESVVCAVLARGK
ncbi:MAG: ComF family protein [Oscillospiraceae bacterium]|nr:ComF family protein [Oscillospiraceae bacterium]